MKRNARERAKKWGVGTTFHALFSAPEGAEAGEKRNQ